MSGTTGLIRPGFLFSQHSLNTYSRCRRRFLLKYVDRQPWPMPENDDLARYQEQLRRGRLLHQWLARRQLGIDMSAFVASCDDRQLREWWQAAQRFDLEELPGDLVEAELPIVVPLGEHRLYARYDLLALDHGGAAVVVDWKTLQSRPSERLLQQRWQTRVYLYTMVAAGQVLTQGPPVDADQACMVYWFTNFPDEPSTVRYSPAQFARDQTDLLALVHEITELPREGFAMTSETRHCRGCIYRSLCRRDSSAQGLNEAWLDEDIDFDIDLADIPELEY